MNRTMRNSTLLTDKDVMTVLMISRKTLTAMLNGRRKLRHGIDLRKAEPIIISAGSKRGQRRWPATKLASVTGLSLNDIWTALQ